MLNCKFEYNSNVNYDLNICIISIIIRMSCLDQTFITNEAVIYIRDSFIDNFYFSS